MIGKKTDIQKEEFHILPFDEKGKKKTNYFQLLYVFLMTVILFLVGMINQDSSRTFWIVYPYFFLFLPLIYLWRGVLGYVSCGVRISGNAYARSIQRIRRSAWGGIVLTAIAIACDVVFLVLYHGQIRVGRELVYLVGLLVYLVSGIAYGYFYDRMFAGILVE